MDAAPKEPTKLVGLKLDPEFSLKNRRGRGRKINLDHTIYTRLSSNEVEVMDKIMEKLGIYERTVFLRMAVRQTLQRLADLLER